MPDPTIIVFRNLQSADKAFNTAYMGQLMKRFPNYRIHLVTEQNCPSFKDIIGKRGLPRDMRTTDKVAAVILLDFDPSVQQAPNGLDYLKTQCQSANNLATTLNHGRKRPVPVIFPLNLSNANIEDALQSTTLKKTFLRDDGSESTQATSAPLYCEIDKQLTLLCRVHHDPHKLCDVLQAKLHGKQAGKGSAERILEARLGEIMQKRFNITPPDISVTLEDAPSAHFGNEVKLTASCPSQRGLINMLVQRKGFTLNDDMASCYKSDTDVFTLAGGALGLSRDRFLAMAEALAHGETPESAAKKTTHIR